jgi:hypothetical protein
MLAIDPWEGAMRTFTCAIYERADARPAMSLILAADEARALALARRELHRAWPAAAIEIREHGRLVAVERP